MGGGLVSEIYAGEWGLAKKLCGQKYILYKRLSRLSHKTLDTGGESGIRTEYLNH